MDSKLFLQGISKFIFGLILVGLMLFLSAGSFMYWQAWLLIGILFIPMFAAGIILMRKNPDLLRKRLNAKEQQTAQKTVLLFSGLMFAAVFIFAGLNYRYHWIAVPSWVSWIAAVVFLIGYVLYAKVLRENIWLSRTVEVQEDQKVIDTGLYGIVRHPMYMSTLLLFLSMPIVLGSVISFGISMLYIPIIAKRIQNEEQVLKEGLKGYTEYTKRIKYKVIPFIW